MKLNSSDRFRKFAEAVERINTEKLLLESAREQSELALDLNRLQLQAEHVTSDGKSLPSYVPKSKKSGKLDLYDTGEFQGRMFLSTKELPIFIDSRDGKTGILEKKYGPVLGLTPANEKEFSNEVKKVYVDKLHTQIEVLAQKILY